MEQIRPYLNSNYGFALAGALIAIALSLRAMGILGLVVSFWSGFAFCLGIEAFAIYYFLLKIDTKTQAKLEDARKLNREVNLLMEEAGNSELARPAESAPAASPARPPSLASSRAPSSSNLNPASTASPGPSTAPTSGAALSDVKPTLEGPLTIQFVGKKKARNVYNCVLRGGVLYYKKRVGMGSSKSTTNLASASNGSTTLTKDAGSGELKQIALTGAQIRRVEEVEIKGMKYAIEVLHPERKIIYKIDYLYLITESEMDLERWYFALLTCCVPHNGYIDVELNKLLHDRFKYMWHTQETANWLSAIWARFHLNMRVSTALREKLINKVALRLSEKIEEKGYQNYIGNLQITDLDFGSKPPTIESAMIRPPDQTGDLIADVWLHYRTGDASLTLSCEVNFKRIMIIPIVVTVSCKSLSGKLQLRIPPFPAERFAISFQEEPTMDLVIEMGMGEKSSQVKNMILPAIKDIILSRLKLAIVERFVAPHRKYFRIPGTAKKDPASDKPAVFAVKTSLKTLPNTPSTISPPPSHLAASSSSVTSDDDFSNWSPSLSRNASTTSIPDSASPLTRADMIQYSLDASSSSPPGSEKMETERFEERVMAPNGKNTIPTTTHGTGPGASVSTRGSLSAEALAEQLENIGLAPVPSSSSPSSRSRSSPSRKNSGTIPGDEGRLSTKVKGLFRSLIPKSETLQPAPNTAATGSQPPKT